MSRVIHADVIAEFAKPSFRTAHLLMIDLAQPIYLSDYSNSITYGGITYEAGGHLLSMAAISETSDVRVGSISLNLSGVMQSNISLFLTTETTDRRVVLSRVAIDVDGSVIGNPITVYDGRLTGFNIQEDGDSSELVLTIASHWADWESKAGRKTNDNSQRMFFSSDSGMAFSGLITNDLKWGRA